MYTDQGDIWRRRRNHCLFLQAKVKGGGYCAASRVQHSVNDRGISAAIYTGEDESWRERAYRTFTPACQIWP